MKRRTDTYAQQSRIKIESAARKAQTLAELAMAEWARLRAHAPHYATIVDDPSAFSPAEYLARQH